MPQAAGQVPSEEGQSVVGLLGDLVYISIPGEGVCQCDAKVFPRLDSGVDGHVCSKSRLAGSSSCRF